MKGPAGRCVQNARDGKVILFVSPYVLGEIREIHLKTRPVVRSGDHFSPLVAASTISRGLVKTIFAWEPPLMMTGST